MTVYHRMWGELGYGKRHARVMATNASNARKLGALSIIWKRMLKKL